MSRERSLIDRAVKFLRPKVGRPRAAVILGSGMSGALPVRGRDIRYAAIPGWPRATVQGHAGLLSVGEIGGLRTAVLRGRSHLYEGFTAAEVARPVRVMARLGAKVLVVTNAAGAVNPKFRPGDLMAIRDHINLTGADPLEGENLGELGPRFPDLSRVYRPDLAGRGLRRGVYAAGRGPSYETPAEIRMLRKLGADAVGMSTVPEVIAAAHAGMQVVGISCITNRAAGLSRRPLDHREVLEAGAKAGKKLGRLLVRVIGSLGGGR